MLQTTKCKIFNVLGWIFFGTILARSIYIGIRFGHWMGLVVLIVGFVFGFTYANLKERKLKNGKSHQ